MKNASTFRGFSLAQAWASKSSSSSVGMPSLNIRSEKAKFTVTYQFKVKKLRPLLDDLLSIKPDLLKKISSSLGIPAIHNTFISSMSMKKQNLLKINVCYIILLKIKINVKKSLGYPSSKVSSS